MNAIFERKSVRRYTNKQVSDESIKILLRAGMQAPSANNDQPWHFIVIKDRGVLEEITKIQPYSKPLTGASFAIIVCGDTNLKTYQQYKDFWIQDCSAATENLLIAAQDMGLGAVWMGLYPVREWFMGIKSLLGLPDSVIPLSIVSIGYPAEKSEAEDRYNPSRVHLNRWQQRNSNSNHA